MGASPAFLMACRKAGLEPGRDYDLDSIRVFGTAGSPLPAEGYRYVYEQLGPDVLLINGSGGTDVCSGIVGGSPLLPVYEGEISGRLLGVATDAFDPQGKPLVGELGELVITQADAVDARRALGRHRRLPLPQLVLRACSRGLAPGRLDQVLGARQLRRHGPLRRDPQPRRRPPRHGRVLQRRRGAAGDHGQPRRPPRGRRGRRGRARCSSSCSPTASRSTTSCAAASAASLRSQLSPRHVPDTIRAVPAIPRTLTGKKLEAPVKRILRGDPVGRRRQQGLAPRPRRRSTCSPRSRPRRRLAGRHVADAPRALRGRRRDRRARPRRDVGGGRRLAPRRAARRGRASTSAASRRGRRRWSSREYYRERRMMAVVFTVDAESFTGQKRVPNEEIAEVARANADVLIPFASIDPHKGRRGVDEARRLIAEHGVRGFKFHPNVQGFFPNDRHGLPALRGDRGGRAAGALPHRPFGRRLGPAAAAAASGSSTRTRCTSTTSRSTSPT